MVRFWGHFENVMAHTLEGTFIRHKIYLFNRLHKIFTKTRINIRYSKAFVLNMRTKLNQLDQISTCSSLCPDPPGTYYYYYYY